jgi:hypothetical protein
LQGPFIGHAGFDCHGIAAGLILFLKYEALQGKALGNDSQSSSRLHPANADYAAIPVSKTLTKWIP